MLHRVLLFIASVSLFLLAGCSKNPEFDLLITNGSVYDGTGAPPVVVDVGIRGDRIVAIGNFDTDSARQVIDASGLAVAPGFIDIHSHAIRENRKRSGLALWPDAENEIRQGVTTVIGGPDGGSPLPLTDTFAELEALGTTVNYGSFIGHGSVRALVVGEDDRPPTESELQAMRDVVAQGMRDGAFGLSSGLVYAPGSFATTEEVIELARVAAQYGGIYISHMRDEGRGILGSVAETIRIGKEAGLPAQITHHKVVGASMWGATATTLQMVDTAVEAGIDVTMDQYPYTASSTSLQVLFPQWALDGNRKTRDQRMQDPAQHDRLIADVVDRLAEDRGGNDPARVVMAECTWNTDLNGLSLRDILLQREQPVTLEKAAELVVELELAGGCTAVYHAIAEEDVLRVMSHSRAMIASDGGVYVPGVGVPHPRNYGAFARVLGHYVRDLGHLPLATAIHKMSGMPADRIGLDSRGRIEVGAIADIAVFDAEEVADRATFADPHQYAVGMHHVLVAGEAVLLDGEMTGVRPGRILRSKAASEP